MGVPVDTGLENFAEAILKLSFTDRAKLIGWISETMVGEEAEDDLPSDKADFEPTPIPSTFGEIRQPVSCTAEERAENLDRMAGSWRGSESAEAMIEEIYHSRTTNDRDYLFNE